MCKNCKTESILEDKPVILDCEIPASHYFTVTICQTCGYSELFLRDMSGEEE